MNKKVEFEFYEENGKKMVWLGEENGSGCKYEYKNSHELNEIIQRFVNDLEEE